MPRVAPVRLLPDWLADLPTRGATPKSVRVVLSLREPKPALRVLAASLTELTSLSGPEGGLTETEERAAREHGFMPLQLGPRTLRADTAPLALLAHLALNSQAQLEGRE